MEISKERLLELLKLAFYEGFWCSSADKDFVTNGFVVFLREKKIEELN